MTDTQMMDFLQQQAASISIRTIRENPVGGEDEASKLYRKGMRIEVFTIASQHVYGRDLRHAIFNAMTETMKRE